MNNRELMWWGYHHVDGSVHVKRLLDHRDPDDARQSDFVATVVAPFPARSHQEALTTVRTKLLGPLQEYILLLKDGSEYFLYARSADDAMRRGEERKLRVADVRRES